MENIHYESLLWRYEQLIDEVRNIKDGTYVGTETLEARIEFLGHTIRRHEEALISYKNAILPLEIKEV